MYHVSFDVSYYTVLRANFFFCVGADSTMLLTVQMVSAYIVRLNMLQSSNCHLLYVLQRYSEHKH